MMQLRHSECICGWIFQVARNVIVDYFRTKTKEMSISDLNGDSDDKSLNTCVETCPNDMLHYFA